MNSKASGTGSAPVVIIDSHLAEYKIDRMLHLYILFVLNEVQYRGSPQRLSSLQLPLLKQNI